MTFINANRRALSGGVYGDNPALADIPDPEMEFEHGEAIDAQVRAVLKANSHLQNEEEGRDISHEDWLTAGYAGSETEIAKRKRAFQRATVKVRESSDALKREAKTLASVVCDSALLPAQSCMCHCKAAVGFAEGWTGGREHERENLLGLAGELDGVARSVNVRETAREAIGYLFALDHPLANLGGAVNRETGKASDFAVETLLDAILPALHEEATKQSARAAYAAEDAPTPTRRLDFVCVACGASPNNAPFECEFAADHEWDRPVDRLRPEGVDPLEYDSEREALR